MRKDSGKEMYHKQMIEMAEVSKETLIIRKEIIIDETTSDEELGKIVRMMYKAKVDSANEHIAHLKRNLNEN